MSRPLYISACLLLTSTAAYAETTQLPTIVTTASRYDEPGYAVGSSVTVIEGKDLEDRQIRFVSDALRAVPGLAVSRLGPVGGQTQVRMRGADANMTLILVDGVRINDPGVDDSVDLSQIAALNVERIEVLRGAQSVLWGSSASGGVINIITRKGGGAPKVTLNTEGGSFGTTQFDGNVSGGGARYNYVLGGSRFDTNGVSSAKGGSETDPFRQSTFYGNASYTPIDALTFSVSGHSVLGQGEFDHPPVDDINTSQTRQDFGQASAKLRLFDGHYENILQGSLLHTESETNDGLFGISATEGKKRLLSDQSNVFWETDLGVPLAHRFTFLVEDEQIKGNVGFASGGVIETLRNTGYAGEYGVSFDDRLFLTGGLRFDDNNHFKNATTYRVTAAWRIPSTQTRFHSSYGTGVKNPTLVELFGFGGTFVGNPNLKPEATRSVDLGVEQTLLSDRLNFDVTVFSNKITDFIQTGITSSTNLAGETQIKGLEVSAKALLAKGLTLDMSYTAMDTQSPQHAELLRRPRNIGGAVLNYETPDNLTDINLSVDYNGRSRDQAFNGPFDFFGTLVDLEPYTLVTIGASHKLTSNVILKARVENALDQDYENARYYANPGIGAYAGLTVTFGG